jgi:hypothetical protein
MYISNFKPEEYLKTSNEPYISNRASTNLLNTMYQDENSRATVSELLITSLMTQGYGCLQTDFHLNWAMECIGYSFSLPPKKYFSLISNSILIYNTWLNNPVKAPNIIQSKLIYYQKEIFCHFSLAFYIQKDYQKQSELCVEILNSIKSFIRAHEINKEIWDCIIKLFLIIFREFSRSKLRLPDNMTSKLIRVFIEIWIRSYHKDKGLSIEFKNIFESFVNNYWSLSYWYSVTKAYTKKVLSLVYCENDNPIVISFNMPKGLSEDKELLEIKSDPDQIFYFWYRSLELFLKQDIVMSVDTSVTITKYISDIIDMFLIVCDTRNKSQFQVYDKGFVSDNRLLKIFFEDCYHSHQNYLSGYSRLPIPSINDLLSLFGPWLFNAADPHSASSSQQKAEAVRIICEIFSRAQGPSLPYYSHKFYSILIETISNTNLIALSQIVKSLSNINYNNPYHLDFLLRNDGIIQIIELYVLNKDTEISVKRSCYSILASISGLASFYKLPDLFNKISNIFFYLITSETDEECFFKGIWGLTVFLCGINEEQYALQKSLLAIVEKLGDIYDKDYNVANNIILLDALTLLSNLIDTKLLNTDLVNKIIKILSVYITKKAKINEEILSRLLICIVDWVSKFPGTFAEISSDLFKLFNTKKTSKRLKEFYWYIRFHLFNSLCRPLHGYSGYLLKMVCNVGVGEDRNFLFNKTTFLSFSSVSETFKVVGRNLSGVFSWKINFGLPFRSYQKCFLGMNTVAKPLGLKENHAESDFLFDELSDDEKKIKKKIENLFSTQEATINHYIPNTFPKKLVKPQESPENNLKKFRNLISELGFIEQKPNSPFQLCDPLIPSSLDEIPEKVQIIFPIFYISSPEDPEPLIMSASPTCSKEFEIFLSTTGVLISETSPPILTSSKLEKYKKLIYKNYQNFESIAVFPGLLGPNSKISFIDLIGLSSIIVLWNQRATDPYSKKDPSILSQIHDKAVIILTPIGLNLISVSIHSLKTPQGPLIHNMIVPQSIVSKLLAYTIYTNTTTYAARHNIWKQRKDFIDSATGTALSVENSNTLFE